MAMSQRPRHVTLRRQRDDPHVRNSTQQSFRKPPVQVAAVVSEPMARLPRWPKNVFFASDFIADRASTAAAAAAVAAAAAGPTVSSASSAVSSANARHTVRESINRGRLAPHLKARGSRTTGGMASRPKEDAGALNRDRRSDRRSPRGAPMMSGPLGRYCAVRRSGDKGEMRVAEEHLGSEGRGKKSGNKSTIHNSSTRKVPAVAGKKEAVFLEESASALLFLHSRFFRGVQRDEDLVCRLCMLCKEAGWMGDHRGVYSGLDPLVLDGLLAERLDAKRRRRRKAELQGVEHSDRHRRHRPAGGGVLSFEDFYQTLADIACLIYPNKANDQSGARSGRAMQTLLVEGAIPLAADNKPRVWFPRPEVLYGRPALTALRAQRDSLHKLYCGYSGTSGERTGSAGVSRSTFLRMLRDLGACPSSVSGEHATEVFDAVLRNGLPESQSNFNGKNDSKSHGVIDNGWMADGTDENIVSRKGRTEVADRASISRGGRLCWSLFLEVMAALAVGAVEDRRYGWTARNDCPGYSGDVSPQSRHHDAMGDDGNQYLRRPGTIGEAEQTLPRRDGSRLSVRHAGRPSGAVRGGDDETRDFDESLKGSEKRRHKANEKRILATSARDHAMDTAGLNSKTDRHLHWREPYQFDDTGKMKLIPTFPERNALQEEQVGMPARRRLSPDQLVEQRDGFQGRPATFPSKTACEHREAATITVHDTPETRPTAQDTVTPMLATVIPEDARQTESSNILVDRVHVARCNDEQRPTVPSPSRNFPPSPHTVADERAPFGGGARVTNLAEQKPLWKENGGTITDGSTQAFQCLAAEENLTVAAVDKMCYASEERLLSKSARERPVGMGKQTESPISNQNKFDAGATTSEGRPIKRQLCASSGNGSAAFQANHELEASTKPQLMSGKSATAVPTAVPSAGDFFPFRIEEDRDKIIDNVQTPAPCHGSSPFALAPSAKPGFKGAQQLEAPVKPVAPQTRNTVVANTTPGVNVGGLENCSNPSPSPRVQSEGLRKEIRSYGSNNGSHRRVEINRTEDEEHCDSGCTVGRDDSAGQTAGRCRPAMRAGRSAATAGASACTSVIFEELLDPKVVAVYSRHREQLISLFRRYSSGSNHDGGGTSTTSCRHSEEPSGCVEDTGMRQFVNDFPSLWEWAQGEGTLHLFQVVRASSDRGWRRVKEKPGVDMLRGASCASSGLCYLGFLEALTRMAHAAKGNSPIHEKLLAIIRPLQADDHHPNRTI